MISRAGPKLTEACLRFKVGDGVSGVSEAEISQSLWTDCSLSPSKRKHLNLFEFAPLLRHVHVNSYYLIDVDVT